MEGLKNKAERPKGDFDAISTPEEFLQKVDFETINDIYDQLIEKAGGKEKVVNSGHRVEPAQVVFTEKPNEVTGADSTGVANIKTGEILLLWENEGTLPTVKALELLKTLIHESTHVRGGYSVNEWQTGSAHSTEWKAGRTQQLGVEFAGGTVDMHEGIGKKYVIGTSVNEAITENISQEVFFEYLTRIGNSSYFHNQEIVKGMGEGSYAWDRLLFGIVIDEVAKSFDVSREDVWKGFIRAYMSGSESYVELATDIKEALSHVPELQSLGTALLDNKSIMDGDLTDLDEIVSYLKKTEGVQYTYEKVTEVAHSFDPERFKNVLGLR